jgi:hypothetical protein
MSKPREERSSKDPAGSAPPRAEVLLDDHAAATTYANLCRVSSTPEEVVIDLAFDASPLAAGTRRVAVSQRVILNHFAAKRLAALLSATVQHHERAFGVLETDFRKRVKAEANAGRQKG